MNNNSKEFIISAGIVLSWTLTPAICQAKTYLSVAEAKQVCFPDATIFIEHRYTLTKEQLTQVKAASGQNLTTPNITIWRAEKNNSLLGYFVTDSVIGKHEEIDYGLAVDDKGAITRVEILAYREKYGGQITNRSWLNNFKGKSFESTLRLNDDIPNISGATLSSRHVTEGIKRVLSTIHILIG